MRQFLMVFLLLSVALAGCGGKGDPLDPYLVKTSEMPDACYHADLESDDWGPVATALGLTDNPGSIPQDKVDEFGQKNGIERLPTSNRVVIFECKLEDGVHTMASLAAKFDDKEGADFWVEEGVTMGLLGPRCTDQASAFRTDKVLGVIATVDPQWYLALSGARDKALERIEGDGAESLC